MNSTPSPTTNSAGSQTPSHQTPSHPIPGIAAVDSPKPTSRHAPSWLEVDLGRLTQNVHALENLLGTQTRINAVIKKDAYGLGGPVVGQALVDAGCRMLTVWSPDEAKAILEAGVQTPILVMMPVWRIKKDEPLSTYAAQGFIHFTIHSLDQLPSLQQSAEQLGTDLPVQLMLDTGMSRGALSPEAFEQAAQQLLNQTHFKQLKLTGIFSHLATADTGPGFAQEQARRFDDAWQQINANIQTNSSQTPRHLANSFGLLLSNQHHHQMVRPGLLLLGFARPGVSTRNLIDGALDEKGQPIFKPIVRWLSHLIHTHPQPAGATVGYGATCTLHRDTMIGLVPVGYADGYPVALSNRAVMRVLNQDQQIIGHAPVLGRVNMDQITVDLTDLKNAGHTNWNEYTLELFANDWHAPNNIPNLAALAETHAYEIICRVANHVPRVYLK